MVPTSTRAQASSFRPEVEVAGVTSRLLVDQIRSIDTRYIDGEPVDFLATESMLDVERALAHYFGL